MKIKKLVKWLEDWNQSLEIDDLEFAEALEEELGLKITQIDEKLEEIDD